MSRKLTFTVLAWIGILVVLELGQRAYDVARDAARERTPATSNRVSTFLPHPFLTYAGNPAYFDHNAQGFRAPKDLRYEPHPTAFRIACLGGSSTYDTRTSREDSYPHQLELALVARSVAAPEVLNAGLGGYSTPNMIGMLALRIVPLAPRIAIFDAGFNDAWNRLLYRNFADDYSHAMRSWDSGPAPPWRSSRLLDRIAARLGSPSRRDPHIHQVAWYPPNGTPVENWRASSSNAFERNLVTLVAIARAHGIRPVLLTQATDFASHPVEHDNAAWNEALREYTTVIERVARELGVDLIDVRAAMSDRAAYFADVLHMTAEGNRERARIVADHLVTHGLVTVAAPR
jgi:lysophospholipase L1-like esterase